VSGRLVPLGAGDESCNGWCWVDSAWYAAACVVPSEVDRLLPLRPTSIPLELDVAWSSARLQGSPLWKCRSLQATNADLHAVCWLTRLEAGAFLDDLKSAACRRIVGWQAAASLHAELALDALGMAIWSRRSEQLEGFRSSLRLRRPIPGHLCTERLAEAGARHGNLAGPAGRQERAGCLLQGYFWITDSGARAEVIGSA
jgi:hypothetical protein